MKNRMFFILGSPFSKKSLTKGNKNRMAVIEQVDKVKVTLMPTTYKTVLQNWKYNSIQAECNKKECPTKQITMMHCVTIWNFI